MKTYHIYNDGKFVETVYAYSKESAIDLFVNDNPMYRFSNLVLFQVVIP